VRNPRAYNACKTGKKRYPTEQVVRDKLLSLKIKRDLHGNHWRHEEKVYKCPFCQGWHTTSQGHKKKKGQT
jgi:hypothetical protein